MEEGKAMKPRKIRTLLGLVAAFSIWIPVVSQAQDSSSITQLAAYTAQGVTKQVTGELTSWGMAQLGFPSTNSTAQLQSLLEEVVAELAAIQQDVADLDCISNAQDAQQAAARIQGAWTIYEDAIQAGYISAESLNSWTDYVRGTGTNSLTADIQLISNDFTGQGSGQSILASCETAQGVEPPAKDTLDDRTAWAFSTNLIDYYADTEIIGIAMLADDFHLQAYQDWLAEGNTADDTTTDNLPVDVCGNPPANSRRAGACNAAAVDYTTYRQNVVGMLDYGGAPYSTDEQWLLNGEGLLWVVNYNDFMTAGGYSSSCVASNSAGTPCGAGVGAVTLSKFYKLDSTSDEVSYGSYVTAWSPAKADAWTTLLKNWKTDHLVDYLSDDLGFDRSGLENRFFYTGDTISGDFEVIKAYGNGDAKFHNLEVGCFVSPESPHSHNGVDIPEPFCDKNSFLGLEHISFNHSKSNNSCVTFEVDQYLINDEESETQTDPLISNFEGGRYQMNQTCDDGMHVRGWEDPISNYPPGQPPGWLLSYRAQMTNTDDYGPYDSGAVTSPVNNQYRYPVVYLDDYYQQQSSSCTTESTNRNDTGVLPSLCGPLLDAYVNAYIPPEPTGAVPALTVPDKPLVVTVYQYDPSEGSYLDVKQPVDYASLVSAFDPDRGALTPGCFPSSGKALGLGITRVNCSATDLDGDSVKGEFDVHVEFPFRFVNKLAEQDRRVALKAGRKVNIRFTMDGYKGLGVITDTPTSTQINCSTGEVMGEPDNIVTNRGLRRNKGHGLAWQGQLRRLLSLMIDDPAHRRNEELGLRYNERQDIYTLPWNTSRSWQGQCRRLSLPMIDDPARTADVKFY
jgi:hypothetical protein